MTRNESNAVDTDTGFHNSDSSGISCCSVKKRLKVALGSSCANMYFSLQSASKRSCTHQIAE